MSFNYHSFKYIFLNNIIKSMSVQGFKNLIKTSLFTDDSFQPLLKKADEYRKITQISIDHFQSIVKNLESHEVSYHKLIYDYQQEMEKSEIYQPQYYHEYLQLYRNVYSQQRSFSEKISNNFRQLTSLCNNLFSNFSNLILSFQGCIRSYKSHEQILFQLSKKYFRTHKNMIEGIEYYKISFTDVKLIYNMDEKIKRFTACQGIYKNLLEQFQIIQEKVNQLSAQKDQIIEAYKDIGKEFTLTLKAVGSKLIALCKSFVFDFCQMQKIIITYLAERKFTLQKIQLKTFFSADSRIKQDDYFNIQIDRSKCELLPSFVIFHKNLKQEYYPQFGKLLNAYVKEMEIKIQQRKQLNKKILEFTSNYMKIYERAYYSNLKEIMTNFQKVKKRLSEIFGSRLCSFLKSINSIFDLSIGINQKLLKRTSTKFKSIEIYIAEQSKLLDLFMKQFKSNIQKFMKKKQVKKIVNQKQNSQFTEEQPSQIDLNSFKNEVAGQSQFLMHLIDGFVQKMKKNYDQLKFQYNALVNDISVSTNQFYSLCCEYQQLYFGDQQFVKNFKKYEIDIEAALKNQSKFFEQINFGSLLRDQPGKIIFDSEINKVQEFKKLKKPTEVTVQELKIEKEKQVIKRKELNQEETVVTQIQRKSSMSEKNTTPNKQQILMEKNQSHVKQKSQNLSKYQQFLYTKITLLQDQKFYKSFSCGLSDKIILTGRLFITNKRLCFHSKFNPSNVFFGDTFIQIPRKDIKKVQKRLNAIVFDNSISITTVNGQVFFTSFFSRNQAYDLICSALDINADDCMFEAAQSQPVEQFQEAPLIQQDDLQENKIMERSENVVKLLNKFQYKQIYSCELTSINLTAFRFFKLFDNDQQFNFNRKTYKSFIYYIKDCLEHKDYIIGNWTPQIGSYLNSNNLKDSIPQVFTKKLSCLVPVSNSGVPFMPKHAKSQQTQTLYFISKDKYIIESIIQNSGVPYSDTFNIRIRKIIQTVRQNVVRMSIEYFVNFEKSTMMKSIIESKSCEETKTAMAKTADQINRYFRFVQKNRAKVVKGDNVENAEANKLEANQQYQKEISELRQNQQKVKQELKIMSLKLQHGKKILLASLIFNILLILILIS